MKGSSKYSHCTDGCDVRFSSFSGELAILLLLEYIVDVEYRWFCIDVKNLSVRDVVFELANFPAHQRGLEFDNYLDLRNSKYFAERC